MKIVLFFAAFFAAVTLAARSRAVTPEMIFARGGTFTMGSPATEGNRSDNEGPQHQVTVNGFYIGKYEVTRKEYLDVMGNNPAEHQGALFPVENVTWYEAVRYCNRRSIKEGLTPAYILNDEIVVWNRKATGCRLPTEAEWEFAARGGNNRDAFLYAGSDSADSAGWHDGNAGGASRRLGTKAANSLGLFDMSGNLGEMCRDFHGAYSVEHQRDPPGAERGAYRVGRGGCWYYGSRYLRAAFRAYIEPFRRYGYGGFRLARDLE